MPTRRHVQPTVLIGLRRPRPELDERIARRVREMWRDGLLDEVRRLEGLGLRHGRTASRALGYAQALAELDGTLPREEAQEQTIAATRRYARRQESWFRPDPRIRWLDAGAADLVDSALAVVHAAVRDNGPHG